MVGNPRFPVFLRIRKDVTWDQVCENAKVNPPPSQQPKAKTALKKQHTILFSTIPKHDKSGLSFIPIIRDEISLPGNIVVTDDDVDDTNEEIEEKSALKKGKDKEKWFYLVSFLQENPSVVMERTATARMLLTLRNSSILRSLRRNQIYWRYVIFYCLIFHYFSHFPRH